MIIYYQTTLGPLGITLIESPFCISAGIDDANGNSWVSPKYTALYMKQWKLADQKDDERAAFIWSAVHKPPKICAVAGKVVVTITTGLDLVLSKHVKKEKLGDIAEVDETHEDGKSALNNLSPENGGCHKRHYADIESIDILRAENEALKEEITRLRQLVVRAGYPISG